MMEQWFVKFFVRRGDNGEIEEVKGPGSEGTIISCYREGQSFSIDFKVLGFDGENFEISEPMMRDIVVHDKTFDEELEEKAVRADNIN